VEFLKFCAISRSPFEKIVFASYLQTNLEDVEFLSKDLD
jgi:hypothetical protein